MEAQQEAGHGEEEEAQQEADRGEEEEAQQEASRGEEEAMEEEGGHIVTVNKAIKVTLKSFQERVG